MNKSALAGLAPGDILVEFNGEALAGVAAHAAVRGSDNTGSSSAPAETAKPH